MTGKMPCGFAMNNNRVLKYIAKFRGLKVAVFGDLILDKYVYGAATRISQEAPVPVVLWKQERQVLGGAANVAKNVVTLSANALPIGVIGGDDAGRELARLVEESGMDASGVVTAPERITTVKTRLIAGNQQIVRLDREQPAPLEPKTRRSVEKALKRILDGHLVDALIFEDYAKGVFDAAVMDYAQRLANRNNVLTMLDPHPSNIFNHKGLALMTPNRKEAFLLAGKTPAPALDEPLRDAELLDTGERLMTNWGPKMLLITLGSKGMILFRKGKAPFHVPTLAKQVFDVSGAGDTVMAAMTLVLLAGATAEEAADIANHAAGVVVGLVGTAPIELEALKRSLEM